MSTPPPNNPPGGFPVPPAGGQPAGAPYYAQPPGRPTNNNGCLKAFGITCGVLIVLGIIGGIALYRFGAGIFGQAMGAAHAIQNGQAIQRAVVAYHTKNGKYPASLNSLVSDGEISDAAVLHNDPDPPGRISWHYHRPAEGAPGNTPILDLPYKMTFGGRTQSTDVIVNLDGTTPHSNSAAPPTTQSP